MNLATGRGRQASARLDVAPVDRSAASKRDRAGQLHRLAGEESQMLGGLVAAARLVEQPAVDADDAVAADHPIAGRDADRERLGLRQAPARSRASSVAAP